DDLVGWIQTASKRDVASLAIEVFKAWLRRDPIAAAILEAAAQSLARDAINCAQRLARPPAPVQFILAGSVLLRQPKFAAKVKREIQRRWNRASVVVLRREGAWGAVELATRLLPPAREGPRRPQPIAQHASVPT